ncbi:Pre-mRNA-splicing factor of RES complex-domain-containing protein [Podospora aff. communis PSN243]|uniref:Pre-mRNA-splicing factor of RES complex-domain-containing protein n=1 Tax=Podospora aff. communis PSN243 TaxID=3040156 RepID=A0AAV9GQQ9_9PEZI|nr:Pre-mRNA-splicing factor of RES complex-domain-containing protein [Podospora aff. communis PSN243]
MPSDKVAYLASHYLSTDTKPPSKKRKRKHAPSASSGLLIQDDDEPGWSTTSRNPDEADEADGPALVAGTSAEFRRAKKSAWKTLSSNSAPNDSDSAAADAIIASAAAEQAAAAREADGEDAVDPGPVAPAVPMMSDGTHAGLQSAAAITAQLKLRQQAEREELERLKAERAAAEKRGEAPEGEGEVVLRDATGRRVDAAMRRAEMRRAAAEAEKAEEMRKRALKGEVQLEEARKRREALEDAALMPLARCKDDEEMNMEMKAAARWNDPMAQFLSNEGRGDGKGGRKKGMGRRPVYKGPAAPNRYGIRPGYRWDGVDRGNGFEAERFKAINRKERVKGLEYAWQMDE